MSYVRKMHFSAWRSVVSLWRIAITNGCAMVSTIIMLLFAPTLVSRYLDGGQLFKFQNLFWCIEIMQIFVKFFAVRWSIGSLWRRCFSNGCAMVSSYVVLLFAPTLVSRYLHGGQLFDFICFILTIGVSLREFCIFTSGGLSWACGGDASPTGARW